MPVTPDLIRLVKLMDPQDLVEFVKMADEAAPIALRTSERQLRRTLMRFGRQGVDARQRRFDLDEVGLEPDVVTPCMSPPRRAIRDYLEWLRAGGGRPVTGQCGVACPCGGAGAPWTREAN